MSCMCLTPLDCIPKDGSNGTFYVIYFLATTVLEKQLGLYVTTPRHFYLEYLFSFALAKELRAIFSTS